MIFRVEALNVLVTEYAGKRFVYSHKDQYGWEIFMEDPYGFMVFDFTDIEVHPDLCLFPDIDQIPDITETDLVVIPLCNLDSYMRFEWSPEKPGVEDE